MAAAKSNFSKDDEWIIYMYICSTDLEENSGVVTANIAEMQKVKLPKNVKILIIAGGSKIWYYPTLQEGGNGIYLYTSNRLQKLEDWTANMGDPETLATFIQYGEDNFQADHRILIFGDHGGLNGLCYDNAFTVQQENEKGELETVYLNDNLTYDELNKALSAVKFNSPEEAPFELIAFDTCVSASYELANSVADFSHYMIGSEPSEYGWYYTDWLSAFAKNPTMNGAEIGKAICDSNMKDYPKSLRAINAFSVIDLSKMPQLREAYEEFFSKAVELSKGAFARAAEAKNIDRYEWYTDLGTLAKNTKDLMPKESKKLGRAINNAVVYNKVGSSFNGKGISTYYPYISTEKLMPYISYLNTNSDELAAAMKKQNIRSIQELMIRSEFNKTSGYNSTPEAQQNFYKQLLNLQPSNLQDGKVDYDYESTDHIVATLLDPEQLKNISRIECIVSPIIKNGDSRFGVKDKAIVLLTSADDLKVDWKKGIVTENFRAVTPVFDGHPIQMSPSVSGRGYNLYEVPIRLTRGQGAPKNCVLQVRYDISKKEYSILGIKATVNANGMVESSNISLRHGDVLTPIFLVFGSGNSLDATEGAVATFTTPEGDTAFFKTTFG